MIASCEHPSGYTRCNSFNFISTLIVCSFQAEQLTTSLVVAGWKDFFVKRTTLQITSMFSKLFFAQRQIFESERFAPQKFVVVFALVLLNQLNF